MAVKPKKKCCRSKPRCKRCPVRLKKKALKKARKRTFEGLAVTTVTPAAISAPKGEKPKTGKGEKDGKKAAKKARKQADKAARRVASA